jgi:acetyl esterase/lipase
VGLLAAVVLLGGCMVNEGNIASVDRLSPSETPAIGSQQLNVAYGSDPQQFIDVYRPVGPAVGTLLYFHSGGWIGGDPTQVVPFVMAEINRGWDIVSVEYRDAPSHRVPSILEDADRALRYTKANAASLGISTSTFIAAGASAGGQLALMLALAPGYWVDPTLPPELASIDPHVDAVFSMVGISDFSSFSSDSAWGQQLSEEALGCSFSATPIIPGSPPCDLSAVERVEPLWWAEVARFVGGSDPPAYLACGAQDTLVVQWSQCLQLEGVLEHTAGYTRAYYDLGPDTGHNADYDLNKTIFDSWLDKVRDRSI